MCHNMPRPFVGGGRVTQAEKGPYRIILSQSLVESAIRIVFIASVQLFVLDESGQ